MENLLIDNMLENAKIGIWVIELSHNKKNDPKMFGNTHMKLLLGVADSYSPEEVYQFWVERIHPAYVSYVEEAVERLISGNKAEVKYPWKHPENGWMYIRCGGYLNTNFTQCYRLEGYHQDISNLIFRFEPFSFDYQIQDQLLFKEYSRYYMDIYDELCEIDPVTNTMEIVFQRKDKYLSIFSGINFFEFIKKYIYSMDHLIICETYNELSSAKKQKVTIDVRIHNSNDGYSWIRLVFVLAQMNYSPKVLMGIMDIQEQKRNMEFFIDSDAILSTIIEENAYIFDIDIMTQNISAIKGENLSIHDMSYNKFLSLFMQRCSDISELEYLNSFLSFNHLKELVFQKKNAHIDIREKTEHFLYGWYRIHLMVPKALEDRILILIKKIDKDDVFQTVITKYVQKNFESLCYIDCDSGKYLQFVTEGMKELIFNENEFDYKDALDTFIESQVVIEDRKVAQTKMNLDYIFLTLQKDGDYFCNIRILDSCGEFHQKTIHYYIYDEDTKIILMMVADTTEQYLLNQSEKEQIERLKLKANTDELTGLYNRYYCKTHINEYLQEVPQGQQAVFLLIDLDNFKNLNDSLGHLAGDQALVDVANVLKNSFCDDAIISRFGGDEFVVFVKNIQDIKLFNRLISRLLQQLDLYYQSEKDQINIQASIGIALAPIDGRDMNTLYLKADKALYQAKEDGKNRYKYYNN